MQCILKDKTYQVRAPHSVKLFFIDKQVFPNRHRKPFPIFYSNLLFLKIKISIITFIRFSFFLFVFICFTYNSAWYHLWALCVCCASVLYFEIFLVIISVIFFFLKLSLIHQVIFLSFVQGTPTRDKHSYIAYSQLNFFFRLLVFCLNVVLSPKMNVQRLWILKAAIHPGINLVSSRKGVVCGGSREVVVRISLSKELDRSQDKQLAREGFVLASSLTDAKTS